MMKLMKTYKPYTVVAVPFPFTDGTNSKRRPALVISSEEFQKKNSHITLLMITSAKHSKWYADHKLQDLEQSGLNSASVVRQKVFTLDSRLVIKHVGKLSDRDRKKIHQKLIMNIAALKSENLN